MDGEFSLIDGFQRLRAADPVHLATDACLSIRRPGMECGLCREACPAGVLSGGLWSIKLETQGCIGCGICAATCPTGAIRVEGFDLPQTPESAEPAEPAEAAEAARPLECRRVPEALRAEGAEVVPCLGGLTAPDLIDRAAEGATIIDRGWCADCPVGHCAAPWEAALSAARDLLALADAGLPERLGVAEAPLPAQEALPVAALRPDLIPNRRDFFRRLVAPAPEPHSPEESQRIVFGRGLVRPIALQRSLDSLRALNDGALPPEVMPAVTINSAACDLHGICAAICPTGALRLTEPGGATLAIDYDATACISCGECQRVCPGKALSLNPAGNGALPEGRETLVTRARGICMGCGDSFAQGAGEMELYCVPCRNSRSLMQDMAHLRGGNFPQV